VRSELKIIIVFAVFVLSCFQGFSIEKSSTTDISDVSLETSTLNLKWASNKHELTIWDVSIDDNKWHSLLATSNEGRLISQHLSIHGVLNGKSIDAIPDSLVTVSCDNGSNNNLIFSYPVQNSGLKLQQIFEESNYPYYFNMSVLIKNNSNKEYTVLPGDSLTMILGPGLGQKKPEQQEVHRSMYYFVEPVALHNGSVYRYSEDSLHESILPWEMGKLSWVGLHNRYFALLLLPNKLKETNVTLPFSQTYINYNSTSTENKELAHDFPVLYFQLPIESLKIGESIQWDFTVFSGPKSYDALGAGSENLRSLLFSDLWSWMRWLCLGLYRLLSFIHFFIPNWGWSIIILALIVRIALYPVAQKAQKSQNKFIEVQKLMLPELSEIKKTSKGGERSELILQLYKKHNVSPFAGLKPLLVVLIQLPILIALFHVLGSAYELNNTSFLWISNLAEPDHLFLFGTNIPLLGEYFNILPFLMALVTLLTFKLSPAPTAEKKDQKLQNIFLIGMTLMFFFLFYDFPSGLVLYWTFANIFHIAQQKLMNRTS
jgi:YidC/Oxa1 family membrane protein insertase